MSGPEGSVGLGQGRFRHVGIGAMQMEPRLLRYIWRHTRRAQIWLSLVILASMPVYFLLLDIPKRIINGPIQGEGFGDPGATQKFLEIPCPSAGR